MPYTSVYMGSMGNNNDKDKGAFIREVAFIERSMIYI